MPYKRPLEKPSSKELMQLFEDAIMSLVRRFRNHPYAFYTETDMHCYLYHRLYSGGKLNGLYRTLDGHETILLHKEYPTVARYKRLGNGKITESRAGLRRGAFDISIWDPQYIEDREHRKQKVLCAAELALNECDKDSIHTVNDATKLAGLSNEVKYGYLLYFVRDNTNFTKNETKIRAALENAAKRVRVAIVCVNEGSKPKPELLGSWGRA